MARIKLTDEQKKENVLARRKQREADKEAARIHSEKNQRPVSSISISIEWKRSRMWGMNPHCDVRVRFKDGTYESRSGYTAGGCGYDKESTVIAAVFNDFLKYKLYLPLLPTDRDEPTRGDGGGPYGMTTNVGTRTCSPYYHGGVGTDCYYHIAKAIGGKFERVASGKTYDAYKYTDNE